jgi:hypothetical protein
MVVMLLDRMRVALPAPAQGIGGDGRDEEHR